MPQGVAAQLAGLTRARDVTFGSLRILSTQASLVKGTAGSATDIVPITANRVAGASPTSRVDTNATQASVNGRGQGTFNISNDGTVANPLTNTAGYVISHSSLALLISAASGFTRCSAP